MTLTLYSCSSYLSDNFTESKKDHLKFEKELYGSDTVISVNSRVSIIFKNTLPGADIFINNDQVKNANGKHVRTDHNGNLHIKSYIDPEDVLKVTREITLQQRVNNIDFSSHEIVIICSGKTKVDFKCK